MYFYCDGGGTKKRIEVGEMQCGFMSHHYVIDAIFIIHQIYEKHLNANEPLYMAFIDLQKVFDRVPRDVN